MRQRRPPRILVDIKPAIGTHCDVVVTYMDMRLDVITSLAGSGWRRIGRSVVQQTMTLTSLDNALRYADDVVRKMMID